MIKDIQHVNRARPNISRTRTRCFGLISAMLFFLRVLPQADNNLVVSFNFNDHTFDEVNHLVKTKPVGVSLVEDRFGNEKSAVFINGNLYSYLNLGTDSILKASCTTISLWVNFARKVYSGCGDFCNPIFIVKNGPQNDFYVAYCIVYGSHERLGITSSRDSLNEAIVTGVNKVKFGEWYHVVMTSSDSALELYVNGKLQGRSKKDFKTHFLENDSVIIGHTANKKNSRYMQGIVDDIQIYHRVLSEKEILDLYHAPDPNKYRIIAYHVIKWLLILGGIFASAFLLVWQHRRTLKRAKEKFDLNRRLHETEIRTLKAQMNPHFIFNSLNSINQFIMSNQNAKAEQYLATFSKLIRELLESNLNESLTIKEEVAILKGYLEMESLRFEKAFLFYIGLAPSIKAESMRIPHMMIQPFVENAIWHGLLPKTDSRRLDIRFLNYSEQLILCEIEDNGVGRSTTIHRQETFKKKSLAFSFIRQRLELMKENHGVDCEVEIIDKKDKENKSMGTLVRIFLPLLKTN